MQHYPVYVSLAGRQCFVLGGCAVAEEKVLGLLEGDARVTVISPEVTARLGELATGLLAAGKAPGTPAAVVASGTTERQRTVAGRLDEIADLARDLESPALTIVGPTAALAHIEPERGRAVCPTTLRA